MYYPYFVAYIVVGVAISLLVFFWALKSGQFSDQQRARFLPLEDEPEPPAEKASKANRVEFVALGFWPARVWPQARLCSYLPCVSGLDL